MSIASILRSKGGCEGGKVIYQAAKGMAEAINGRGPFSSASRWERLPTVVVSALQPLYQSARLSEVRFKARCSLPPNWFTASNNVDGMTFGKEIYFKVRDVLCNRSHFRLLMHELVHVDQVARLGGEDNFACEYGKGYLSGGSYESNPMEREAREFVERHPIPTQIGFPETAIVEWWEDRDFSDDKHALVLYDINNTKPIQLVHNDAMKSLKFYARPGWKLEIYDSPDCNKSDDWGEVVYPANPVDCVSLPRIGRDGMNLVSPAGSYQFHYVNGLPGKVSAVKHYS